MNEALMQEVERLTESLADKVGKIHDSDTVLADIMKETSFEETGISEELFQIWKNSEDKASVEALFYLFTDCTFEEYLERCREELLAD